jgi:REP element-mobilizing transposase RayT
MYYVTINTLEQHDYFGIIKQSKMLLSKIGEIVFTSLKATQHRYNNFIIPNFTIMPNHIHLLLHCVKQTSTTLGEFIRYFKAKSSREIRTQLDSNFSWERKYYDRVVRNEAEKQRIIKYIEDNVKDYRN